MTHVADGTPVSACGDPRFRVNSFALTACVQAERGENCAPLTNGAQLARESADVVAGPDQHEAIGLGVNQRHKEPELGNLDHRA